MSYQIRKSSRDETKDIAHIVTISWNQTYKGIVNDDFLNYLYENESMRARDMYLNYDKKTFYHVLVVDDKIVGFINLGSSSDLEFKNCGEIIALYILKDYQGLGYGRKLFEYGVLELKKQHFDKMIIGCLKGNPTNEFYKHMGGKLIKTTVFKTLNLPENIYLFENI